MALLFVGFFGCYLACIVCHALLCSLLKTAAGQGQPLLEAARQSFRLTAHAVQGATAMLLLVGDGDFEWVRCSSGAWKENWCVTSTCLDARTLGEPLLYIFRHSKVVKFSGAQSPRFFPNAPHPTANLRRSSSHLSNCSVRRTRYQKKHPIPDCKPKKWTSESVVIEQKGVPTVKCSNNWSQNSCFFLSQIHMTLGQKKRYLRYPEVSLPRTLSFWVQNP